MAIAIAYCKLIQSENRSLGSFLKTLVTYVSVCVVRALVCESLIVLHFELRFQLDWLNFEKQFTFGFQDKVQLGNGLWFPLHQAQTEPPQDSGQEHFDLINTKLLADAVPGAGGERDEGEVVHLGEVLRQEPGGFELHVVVSPHGGIVVELVDTNTDIGSGGEGDAVYDVRCDQSAANRRSSVVHSHGLFHDD